MPDAAPIKLTSSQGSKLKFSAVHGREEMARPFEYDVVALAESGEKIDLEGLLGTGASVDIELPDGSLRHLHGIVAAAGLDGTSGRLVAYRLTLRPWLWLLTRRSDTRIFQKMTVVDIIKKVFENYAAEVSYELQGSYPQYEYCVQYRETDFNFVSRLMEDEGIYYFFKHSDGKHQMVICDKMSTHIAYPGFREIKFRDRHDAMLDFSAIEQWRRRFELPPSKVALDDYNFLQPGTDLFVGAKTTRANALPALEFHDQPGEYGDKGDGERRAKVRMEELDARYQLVSGASASVRGIAAGCLFELIEHPLADENGKYVVVSTQIAAEHSGYESGQGQTRFDCHFTAMPSDDVFRPQRSTPKPQAGPQPAVVVGPKGEEIYTDVHGRVKVQFPWDRLGRNDENSSCWMRVSSPLAGKAWGAISLPRIGQEVVVDFVEGDPDRPLIVGRVYNAEQVTPYLLPDHKTISTFKTRSTMKGEPANFNELLFEDKKGDEYIRMHAEKDLIEIVKHDHHLEVDNDQWRVVKNNVTEEIGGDTHLKITGNTRTEVGGNMDLKCGGKVVEKIGANRETDIGAAWGIKCTSDFGVDAGANIVHTAGANYYAEAGANVHIKAGANVVIEAGASLGLKAPKIDIIADGIISIKGSLVNINTGGAASPGCGGSAPAPGSPQAPDPPQALKDIVKKVTDALKKSR